MDGVMMVVSYMGLTWHFLMNDLISSSHQNGDGRDLQAFQSMIDR